MKPACPKCYSKRLRKEGWWGEKQRYSCKDCGFKTIHPVEEFDLLTENVRLAKQKQSAQDKNRIQNKAFRERWSMESYRYCKWHRGLDAHLRFQKAITFYKVGWMG